MKDNKNELLKLKQELEEKDKYLLNLEIVIGILSIVIFFVCLFVFGLETSLLYRVFFIIIGIVLLFVGCIYCLKIEQIAGYYKCKKCENIYVPKYISVFWAMHICRSRYMKCPKCGQYSWNKKVIKKED